MLGHRGVRLGITYPEIYAMQIQAILEATAHCSKEGIDAPLKDTVIKTSPISNIEQITGRIIRDNENKQTPIIIDMVDYGCPEIASTFYKREKFYNKKPFIIKRERLVYLNQNRNQTT